jgi:hypothetical protein
MLNNQMPCLALGARGFTGLHIPLSENASQEFHDVSDFETRRGPGMPGLSGRDVRE